MTDRLVYFFNQVATEVIQTHPDRRLAFYAYLNYTRPPEVVKPHPMLLPVLVHTPWEYCMHHPIDDPDCERNRLFAKNVLGWRKFSPEFGLRDYWGHWALGGPIGMVQTIKRDFPWMHSKGCIGFFAGGKQHWWTQGLNLYLPTKLAWNINADVDAIVAEYYENMFGPAAQAVSNYGQMHEDIMLQVPKDAENDFEQAFLTLITPEFLKKAKDLLDKAETTVKNAGLPGDEAYKITERLKRYRYGLKIAELQAKEKQARLAGRMEKALIHLKSLISVLEEMGSDSELANMIQISRMIGNAKNDLVRLPPYTQIWQKAVPSPERRKELQRKFDQGHTREVARALGYWNDWYVVGLWTNTGGKAMATHFPPEYGVDLKATYEVRSGEAGWRLLKSKDAYGIIDLRQHYKPQDTEYTIAYAFTKIKVRDNVDVVLDLMGDDDLVLWVNNKLVFSGGVVKHNFKINVRQRLRKGENKILAKILNKPHAFKFSVRILSEDGKPHDAVIWE
jgi:hypothetical protein